MAAPAKPRWGVLASALALTLLAMYWVNAREAEGTSALVAAESHAGMSTTSAAGRLPANLVVNQAISRTRVQGNTVPDAALPDLLQRRQFSDTPAKVAETQVAETNLAKAKPEHASPGQAAAIKASSLRATQADLLQAHAWYTPPPVAPAIVRIAPEAPVTPAVPYLYMGKLEDTPDGNLIFLASRNKVQTVKLGQAIDSAWRVDREDANALYLTYLPLDTTQVLSKFAKRNVAASAPAATDALAND